MPVEQIAGQYAATPVAGGEGPVAVRVDQYGNLGMVGSDALGTPQDPKVTDPDDNTADATVIAELKGIQETLQSTEAVQTYEAWSYVRLTDSGQVKASAGTLKGLEVSAAGTAITINVYDNTAGSGTLIYGPRVLTVGTISLPATFGTGCYITFSATTGTPSLTAFYR